MPLALQERGHRGARRTAADHRHIIDPIRPTVGSWLVPFSDAEPAHAGRITFSEFGRRVAENFSGGTNHGLAQPMFLFGPMVNPDVHGKQSSLTDLDENGNLKALIDFRRVYAAILQRWLCTPSEPVLGVKYEPLDCIAS
jgi:hypothetical protein